MTYTPIDFSPKFDVDNSDAARHEVHVTLRHHRHHVAFAMNKRRGPRKGLNIPIHPPKLPTFSKLNNIHHVSLSSSPHRPHIEARSIETITQNARKPCLVSQSQANLM